MLTSPLTCRAPWLKWLPVALLALLHATPASALNILLCNDDSIASANIRALKQTLTQAGHSVAISGPVENKSGSGGQMAFVSPVPDLSVAAHTTPNSQAAERAAQTLALTPDPTYAGTTTGIGTDAADGDVHYVKGSPVAACLYGLDVVALQKWHSAPDLVISGPNEGNNLGSINHSSGTFNNMLYAVIRGIPAMAVSDAQLPQIAWSSQLPPDAHAYEVARVTLRVVDTLVQRQAAQGGRLLPQGLGLNVNLPTFAAGTGTSLAFKFTRVGYATGFAPAFFTDLNRNTAIATLTHGKLAGKPGIGMVSAGTVLNEAAAIPTDTDPLSESNVIQSGGYVTISPVEGMPQARPQLESAMHTWLGGLAAP